MSFPLFCCFGHNSFGDLDLLLRPRSAPCFLICVSWPAFETCSYPNLVSLVVKIRNFDDDLYLIWSFTALITYIWFSATIGFCVELRKLFPFFSSSVGTLLGALTGALIGQETESGFIRGAAIGAISGAVFSIEVFESSLVLWKSNESRFGCLLYLVSWDLFETTLTALFFRYRFNSNL